MNKAILITFLLCGFIIAKGSGLVKKTGRITFVTTQNVYMKFDNTDGISKGDTAYFYYRGKVLPAAFIKYLSSASCAGPKLTKINIKTSDVVYIMIKKEEVKSIIKKAGTEVDTNLVKTKNTKEFKPHPIKFSKNKSNFYGSFSANSFSNYTNYSNVPGIQRWNYTVNLRAEKIGGSDFYFSNYMNLAYLSSEWHNVKANIFNKLKVYDLSLGYKNSSFNIWVGRHLNYNISSIGPMDGFEMEKNLGHFALGGVIGSRPDMFSMGYNFKYFEYGGYLFRTDTLGQGTMQNTVAYFEQTYNKKTDRRFLYLQHTDNIFSNLYLFASSEIDLFKLQNNLPKNVFSLTSIYFYSQYSPFRSLSINLSYDARKNVVYYQSFKSFIDSLFDNQMRQGIRLSFYIRPGFGIFINLGGGYSYQKGDIKPSRNFNFSITKSEIPLLDISVTASVNKLLSNYQTGSIYGISLQKFIPFNITTIMIGFSNVEYNFGGLINKINQKEVTANISTRIINNLFFNLYYEGDFTGTTTYGRFMSGINLRF